MKTIKIFVVAAVIFSSFPLIAQSSGAGMAAAGARTGFGLIGGGGSGLVVGASSLASGPIR